MTIIGSGGIGKTTVGLAVAARLIASNRDGAVFVDLAPLSDPMLVANSAADATRWVQYSHYSLLATVEAIFNLGTLGRNDTSATPMSDLFRGGIP